MISRITLCLVISIFCSLATSFKLGFPTHEGMKHTAFMDNLVEVTNWYYGYGVTQQDYRLKLMEKSLESGSTLVTCEVGRPFATEDMEGCEKCPPQMPLRNLDTARCESCPYGFKFDEKYGNCTESKATQSTNKQSINTNDRSRNLPSPQPVYPESSVSSSIDEKSTSIEPQNSSVNPWKAQVDPIFHNLSSNSEPFGEKNSIQVDPIVRSVQIDNQFDSYRQTFSRSAVSTTPTQVAISSVQIDPIILQTSFQAVELPQPQAVKVANSRMKVSSTPTLGIQPIVTFTSIPAQTDNNSGIEPNVAVSASLPKLQSYKPSQPFSMKPISVEKSQDQMEVFEPIVSKQTGPVAIEPISVAHSQDEIDMPSPLAYKPTQTAGIKPISVAHSQDQMQITQPIVSKPAQPVAIEPISVAHSEDQIEMPQPIVSTPKSNSSIKVSSLKIVEIQPISVASASSISKEPVSVSVGQKEATTTTVQKEATTTTVQKEATTTTVQKEATTTLAQKEATTTTAQNENNTSSGQKTSNLTNNQIPLPSPVPVSPSGNQVTGNTTQSTNSTQQVEPKIIEIDPIVSQSTIDNGVIYKPQSQNTNVTQVNQGTQGNKDGESNGNSSDGTQGTQGTQNTKEKEEEVITHPECDEDKEQYWSEAEKRCLTCQQNYEYVVISNSSDEKQGVCKPKIFMTNLQGQNLKIIQPTPTYLQEKYNKIQQSNEGRKIWKCPSVTPYSVYTANGQSQSTCIQCDDDKDANYFQAEQEKCVSGCPHNHIYNSKTSVCDQGVYLTDPSSSYLLSPTARYQKWAQKVGEDKKSIQGARYCPDSRPYAVLHNGMTECIDCDDGKYFNIEMNVCEECPYHRQYNEEVRRCTGVYDDSVSLDRMVSNIW